MKRITLGYPHPYREIDGSVFLMRMATWLLPRLIPGVAGTAIAVLAYNGRHSQPKGFGTMSQNNSRSVLAGLVSLWLVIAGSPSGVAAGEPPGASNIMLAQARPNPPPPDIEANISSLHQRLQITPAQEAQFSAVANVLRANARAEASAPHQPPANASAVDELRAEIQYDEVELAGLKRLLPALEALYASFSPVQRQTADAAFRQGPGG